MKKLKLTTLSLALAGVMVLGVAAASSAQKITADLRPDVTVTLDGKTQALTGQNGETLYPIMYDGVTYLPVRAVGELTGKTVTWDGKAKNVGLSGADAVTSATPKATSSPSATAPATSGNTSFSTEITALDKKVTDATPSVTDFKSNATNAKQTWQQIKATLNTIEGEIDRLDDRLEAAYQAGTLAATDYRALEKSLDLVDNRLERLDDTLDARMGLDD